MDCQAHLSSGFSKKVYWSGLPFSFSGDFPDPRIKPASPAFAGRFFTTESSVKPPKLQYHLALNNHIQGIVSKFQKDMTSQNKIQIHRKDFSSTTKIIKYLYLKNSKITSGKQMD